jgi:hypothetical protein
MDLKMDSSDSSQTTVSTAGDIAVSRRYTPLGDGL